MTERETTLHLVATPQEAELPEGLSYGEGLTPKHIKQLVEYTNNPEDTAVEHNTSDRNRFKDEAAVSKWLEKGRSITTITNKEGDLLGISWLGADHMPSDSKVTTIVVDINPTTGREVATPTTTKVPREFIHAVAPYDRAEYGVTFAIRMYGDSRGQGLSGKLTARAIDKYEQTEEYQNLAENGKNGVWLEVSASNAPAVKSYERSNFLRVTHPDQTGKVLMTQPRKVA